MQKCLLSHTFDLLLQNKRGRKAARKSAKLAAAGGSVAVEAERPQV